LKRSSRFFCWIS